MKRKSVLVACYGMLWRLTQSQWNDYLRELAGGGDPDLDYYGVRVGPLEANVTDMDAAQARSILGLDEEEEDGKPDR